jgi:zinc protease
MALRNPSPARTLKPSTRAHAHTAAALSAVALSALLLPALVFGLGAASHAGAQTVAPTREASLLNGLKIAFYERPGEQKVSMRLRVHSGAAFDLAGKEGLTLLLGDALFPDPATRQYVAEELGGSLEVRTNYDLLEIDVTGDAGKFDRLVELLRGALLQTRFDAAEVARLREARVRELREAAAPAAVADAAVAARLFGPHPYARPARGTAESLARVERADLMLARERFLNPNNATLVVTGGFETARAMRIFRQYLGPWRRGDTVVPATFKQPAAPDARALVVEAPGATTAEVRLAARGLARSDRDRLAASALAAVARERWQAALKDAGASNVSARHDPRAVGGLFQLGASVPASSAARAVEAAREVLRALASSQVTAAEIERARRELSAGPDAARNTTADELLDSHTYGTRAGEPAAQLTPAELQRVAARLFREAQFATVVVGDGAQLRAALAGLPGGVETREEKTAEPAAVRRP